VSSILSVSFWQRSRRRNQTQRKMQDNALWRAAPCVVLVDCEHFPSFIFRILLLPPTFCLCYRCRSCVMKVFTERLSICVNVGSPFLCSVWWVKLESLSFVHKLKFASIILRITLDQKKAQSVLRAYFLFLKFATKCDFEYISITLFCTLFRAT